jgi:hypothetical protein
MDEEFVKYQKLIKSYPNIILVEPGSKSFDSYTHYDILTTRYLYMKTFNSVPPENIWKLKYGLNPTNLTCDYNNFEDAGKLINIIIGYSEENQLTVKFKKMFNTSLTINQVFDYIKSDPIKNIKPISNCVCIGPNGLISPNTLINQLESTQFIILVNF